MKFALYLLFYPFRIIFHHMKIEELFTRNRPVRGILSIKNMLTGRTYLTATEDAVNDITKERFSLDLGTHRSAELQKDYSETGLELFSIDLEKEAGSDEDLRALLERTEKEYKDQGISLYR